MASKPDIKFYEALAKTGLFTPTRRRLRTVPVMNIPMIRDIPMSVLCLRQFANNSGGR
jgi:hypothetical protein